MNVEEKKKNIYSGKDKSDQSKKKKRKQESNYHHVLEEKVTKKVKFGYDDWCDQFIYNEDTKAIEMDMVDLLNILTSTMDTLLMYEVAIIRNPNILRNRRIQVYIKKRVRNALNIAYLWHTDPGLFDLASDMNGDPDETKDYNEIVNCCCAVERFNFERGRIEVMEQEMLRLLRQLQYRCVLYFDFDRFNKKGGRNSEVNYCDATFTNPLKQPMTIGNEVKIDKNELRKEVELCNYYPLCTEHGLFKGPVCEKCMKDHNQKLMIRELERMARKYGGEQNLIVEKDKDGTIVCIKATRKGVEYANEYRCGGSKL